MVSNSLFTTVLSFGTSACKVWGWLNIRLPELGKTYRMYYKESTSYDQLTPLEGTTVAGKIKVKFREPVPTI